MLLQRPSVDFHSSKRSNDTFLSFAVYTASGYGFGGLSDFFLSDDSETPFPDCFRNACRCEKDSEAEECVSYFAKFADERRARAIPVGCIYSWKVSIHQHRSLVLGVWNYDDLSCC